MKKFQALLVLVSLVFITFVGNAFGAEGESQPQTTGWFRVDSDALGLQVWAGGTHKVGPLNLASLIYVNSAQRGEFDLGLSFTHKSLTIVPMNGFQFDWGERRLVSLIPETFIYVTPESIPLYFESWVQFFVNRPFTDLPNQFYTRDYLLMRVSKNLLFGPQAELLMNVQLEAMLTSCTAHLILWVCFWDMKRFIPLEGSRYKKQPIPSLQLLRTEAW